MSSNVPNRKGSVLNRNPGSEVPTSTERPGYCVFKVPAKELMVWAKGFGVYFAITAASGALQKDPVAVLTMAPVTGILVTVIHSAGRYIRGR